MGEVWNRYNQQRAYPEYTKIPINQKTTHFFNGQNLSRLKRLFKRPRSTWKATQVHEPSGQCNSKPQWDTTGHPDWAKNKTKQNLIKPSVDEEEAELELTHPRWKWKLAQLLCEAICSIWWSWAGITPCPNNSTSRYVPSWNGYRCAPKDTYQTLHIMITKTMNNPKGHQL